MSISLRLHLQETQFTVLWDIFIAAECVYSRRMHISWEAFYNRECKSDGQGTTSIFGCNQCYIRKLLLICNSLAFLIPEFEVFSTKKKKNACILTKLGILASSLFCHQLRTCTEANVCRRRISNTVKLYLNPHLMSGKRNEKLLMLSSCWFGAFAVCTLFSADHKSITHYTQVIPY